MVYLQNAGAAVIMVSLQAPWAKGLGTSSDLRTGASELRRGQLSATVAACSQGRGWAGLSKTRGHFGAATLREGR